MATPAESFQPGAFPVPGQVTTPQVPKAKQTRKPRTSKLKASAAAAEFDLKSWIVSFQLLSKSEKNTVLQVLQALHE